VSVIEWSIEQDVERMRAQTKELLARRRELESYLMGNHHASDGSYPEHLVRATREEDARRL